MPNAGFLDDVVFEDPTLSSAQISDSYDGANDGTNDQLNGIDDKDMGQYVDVADVQSEPSSASVAYSDARNETAEEVTAHVGDLNLTDDDSADQLTREDQHPLSTEDVDMLLEKCLLQALHTTVKDKDLPMPGSTLWYGKNMIFVKLYMISLPSLSLSTLPEHINFKKFMIRYFVSWFCRSNYVLPCRPSGITLDIKKSSYKKLSKWLQAKSSSGLVRYAFIILIFEIENFFSFKPVILRAFIYIGLFVVFLILQYPEHPLRILCCCQHPVVFNSWFDCCAGFSTILKI